METALSSKAVGSVSVFSESDDLPPPPRRPLPSPESLLNMGRLQLRKQSSSCRLSRRLSRTGDCLDVAIEAEDTFARRREDLRRENEKKEKAAVRASVKSYVARKRAWYILDPTAQWVVYFDVLTGVCLIFTALVTPYEVALVPPASDTADTHSGLFILNRMVDGVFVIDLVLQFLFMYKSREDGWVANPHKIACHYLKTWFVPDILSVGVGVFDYLPLVIDDTDDLAKLKVLRALRALRLVKLVRLLKASRIFKRWETRLAINYTRLDLVKSLAWALLCAHWIACMWVLQAMLIDVDDSWLGPNGQQFCYKDEDDEIECDNAGKIYCASLYFALSTITSVGYGDVTAMTNNTAETAIASIVIFVSALVWAHVIASFCSVIANMNPRLVAFRQTLDELNSFMSSHQLCRDMRVQLREFFHQRYRSYENAAQHSLFDQMSPKLQGEVLLSCNEKILRNVWFLQTAANATLVEVALSLTPFLFTPAEHLPPEHLYIIHRGSALYRLKVHTSGSCWGEDIILSNRRLRDKESARALLYLQVFCMSPVDFQRILRLMPVEAARLRWVTIKFALKREILIEARARREAQRQIQDKEVDQADFEDVMQTIQDKVRGTICNPSETSLSTKLMGVKQIQSSKITQLQMGGPSPATNGADSLEENSTARAAPPPVLHSVVRHPKHGRGVVSEILPDGRRSVTFDNGDVHRYGPHSWRKLHPVDVEAEAEAERLKSGITAATGSDATGWEAFAHEMRASNAALREELRAHGETLRDLAAAVTAQTRRIGSSDLG